MTDIKKKKVYAEIKGECEKHLPFLTHGKFSGEAFMRKDYGM